MGLSVEAQEHRKAQAREYMRKKRANPEFKAKEREYGRGYETTKRERDPEYKRTKARETARRAYAKDPEKIRARSRQWYADNSEQARLARRKYSQRPEVKAAAAAYARKWRAANPAQGRARIWKKKGAPAKELEYVEILLKDPCSYCGGPAGEIDHIVPVSDNGTSDWENLTASCPFCNRSKHHRPLLAWLVGSQRK